MTVNVPAPRRQEQRTYVKDCIMTWVRRCLQEDVFSDCYIVTSEGLRVPAHKAYSLPYQLQPQSVFSVQT